ncbi:hypothetical protein RJ640_008741 [Escallonia rubra]|uniref:Uncharacterized protein n=1 Tax=Escallonia rubra TaxID=112253 RepID=A0AA88QUB6_9ASTE|nr:hypothetical protein RJ640_008741 [Escallonia rubra]
MMRTSSTEKTGLKRLLLRTCHHSLTEEVQMANRTDTDVSFVSSARPSIDRLFPSYGDNFEMGATPRLSNFSDVDRHSFESFRIRRKSADSTTSPELSYSSFESDMSSPSQATIRRGRGRDEEAKAGAQANNGHVQYCLQRSNLGKTEGR